jgi:glucokinase
MSNLIIGVNIEDKHLSAGLVDIETRKVVSGTLQRKRIDPSGSAEQIIAAWTKILKEVAGTSKNIGIGLPGKCDYESGLYLLNEEGRYNSLFEHNLKEIFSDAIDSNTSNVKIMNDAASFLQGEVFSGSGRGFKSSLGITLGVGLGSAVYENGKVTDANLYSMAFKDGLAEDYISIRGLISRFKQLSGTEIKDLAELRELGDGDANVKQLFDEFASNLASFLELFIRKNNPEVVVIGGYMEIYNRYFFDSLTDKVKALGIKIPVLRAILGEQASVMGAASLWYDASPIHA